MDVLSRKVKLNVEIYSTDIASLAVHRDVIDVSTFDGPEFVRGPERCSVDLTPAAQARIVEALRAAMTADPKLAQQVEAAVGRRGISFGTVSVDMEDE